MPCQVGPVPFRKVNYLAPVGLPNIGGHVQLFIYAHSGKCLLFLLHFCDFFFFKFYLLSSWCPWLGSHPRKRSGALLCLRSSLIWGNAPPPPTKKSHRFTSTTQLYKNAIDYSHQKAQVSQIMLPSYLTHANADSKVCKQPRDFIDSLFVFL